MFFVILLFPDQQEPTLGTTKRFTCRVKYKEHVQAGLDKCAEVRIYLKAWDAWLSVQQKRSDMFRLVVVVKPPTVMILMEHQWGDVLPI